MPPPHTHRCKSNYAALQWDEGASVLFLPDEAYERITRGLARTAGAIRTIFDPSISKMVTQEVADCILATSTQGEPPDACLVDIFLSNQGRKKEDYFVYDSIVAVAGGGAAATSTESFSVDACEVFTGPAAALPPGSTFQDCSTNDLQTQCNIPSFVWSGRSTGRTPVGNFHSWTDPAAYAGSSTSVSQSVVDERRRRAQAEFEGISLEMVRLIKAVNDSFLSDNIAADLFSAEGDALHQLLDCMYMGPYGRMDYGARGGGRNDNLPVPSWSRSNTEQLVNSAAAADADADVEKHSRAFSLPCSGDNLKGDYKVPFTCGSPSRRAVIKYFVRSYAGPSGIISGQCGTEDVNRTVQDANKQRVLAVVRSRLTSLHADWSSFSNFGCEDPLQVSGVHGPQFCTGDPATWMPRKLRDWDHATTSQVAAEIFSSARCFHEKSMRDANVWFQHLEAAERKRYDWSADPKNSYAATESSLFHTHSPVVGYSEDELGEPMSNGELFNPSSSTLIMRIMHTHTESSHARRYRFDVGNVRGAAGTGPLYSAPQEECARTVRPHHAPIRLGARVLAVHTEQHAQHNGAGRLCAEPVAERLRRQPLLPPLRDAAPGVRLCWVPERCQGGAGQQHGATRVCLLVSAGC